MGRCATSTTDSSSSSWSPTTGRSGRSAGIGWATARTRNPSAWNVGIALIPEARGHGYGSEAQRLLAAYLFANTRVNRIEASTDVENIAEQRSLEKAGYVREGVARGSQFRAGAYHDLVTYSRLRDDEP